MENVEHDAEQQPVVTGEVPQHAAAVQAHKPKAKGPKKSKKAYTVVAVALLAVLVVGLAGWYLQAHRTFNENKNINKKEYQAVFLTNGQVYFGKLTDLNHNYATINDIYYLQVQQSQSLQQGTGTDANSQVSLAKLGSELHGPEDKMNIASNQILFWENLKSGSKVVQAITKYQNQ